MKEKSITRITLEEAKSLQDLTDWERIEKMSESEIEQNALDDADNQPIMKNKNGLKRIKKRKPTLLPDEDREST